MKYLIIMSLLLMVMSCELKTQDDATREIINSKNLKVPAGPYGKFSRWVNVVPRNSEIIQIDERWCYFKKFDLCFMLYVAGNRTSVTEIPCEALERE